MTTSKQHTPRRSSPIMAASRTSQAQLLKLPFPQQISKRMLSTAFAYAKVLESLTQSWHCEIEHPAKSSRAKESSETLSSEIPHQWPQARTPGQRYKINIAPCGLDREGELLNQHVRVFGC